MGIIRASARSTAWVRRTDRGLKNIKNVFKSIQQNKDYVKAGVLGGGSRPDDGKLTNAQIAVWLEYGTSKQPARPAIKPAFENNRQKYIDLLAVLVAKKVYAGKMDYASALAIIGTAMAYDMKAFITRGPQIPPPNAPSVLARKSALDAPRKEVGHGAKRHTVHAQGEPRTWIDTGRVVAAITYAVVSGGVKAVAAFIPGHQGDR